MLRHRFKLPPVGSCQVVATPLVITSSSASTSATTSQSEIASTGFFINEPLIVGQDNALARLENFVINEVVGIPFLRIGMVGKGGSDKTLLVKTLFNSKLVRHLFSNKLLLWLIVSQSPSFISLRNEISAQVAMQTEVECNKNMTHEALRVWLNERMQGNRFLFILDDLWEESEKLLEELGLLRRLTDSSISTVTVSSRNHRALLEMGVAEKYIIIVENLNADDSWQLFSYHAFLFITLPSGISGFTTAYWVRPRSTKDGERFPPNNVFLTLAGAGFLWMGWSRFNGGGPYAANVVSSMTVLNTNICAAISLIVWTCLDVVFFKKPSFIGVV